MTVAAPGEGSVEIHHGDNLEVIRGFADGSFTLIYLDPPFNTGRAAGRSGRDRARTSAVAATRLLRETASARRDCARPQSRRPVQSRESAGAAAVVRRGFHGRDYERLRGDLRAYDDRFDDYWGFLEPRLEEAWRLLADDGTLYLHLDYREAHYAKVLLDALFGRDRFLNELIWAYDYGAKTRKRWPTKHDTILVYVKDPGALLVRLRGRRPRAVHGARARARPRRPSAASSRPTSGGTRSCRRPAARRPDIRRRSPRASCAASCRRRAGPGDRVLDFFAGSGTTGAVASALGRDAVLVDDNPEAIAVMTSADAARRRRRRPGPSAGTLEQATPGLRPRAQSSGRTLA